MQGQTSCKTARTAIIGAGMAGLTCAQYLAQAGHTVALFDKGRGPGGRMSTRRIDTPAGQAHFDHGATSFTASERLFRKQVQQWQKAGIVQPWSIAGSDAWVGVPGMNDVIRHLAGGHDVSFGCHVRGLSRTPPGGWLVQGDDCALGRFDTVVLAIPMEQASAMVALHDLDLARHCSKARSAPCWTGLFAFEKPLESFTKLVRNCGFVSLASCNSTKPGRSGPESWVVQANAPWSAQNLEQPPTTIARQLLAGLGQCLQMDLPEPIIASAHRWRYAGYAGVGGQGACWNGQLNLGLCGDWLLGGTVQDAWLSGHAMAQRLIARPTMAAAR